MKKEDRNIIRTVLLLAILLVGCMLSAIYFNGKTNSMENYLVDYIDAHEPLTDLTDFEYLEYTIDVNSASERMELTTHLSFIFTLFSILLIICIVAMLIFRIYKT